MKKIITFIVIFMFLISLILSVFNVTRCIKQRNWYKTELTITAIGLPDGAVFGDYTDKEGVKHLNESVFYDPALAGYKTDTDKYSGKVITISIDPETNKKIDHDRLIKNTLEDIGMFLILGAVLIIKIKKRKPDQQL